MDSDGEDELVDIGSKVEPVKVSEVIARKTAGCLKHAIKNKPKPTPLFNDKGDDILFPEPSEILVQSTQKSIVSPAKVMSRGDKVRSLDTIPKMLEGKHGYPDTTWRLGELVHVSVSHLSFFLILPIFLSIGYCRISDQAMRSLHPIFI